MASSRRRSVTVTPITASSTWDGLKWFQWDRARNYDFDFVDAHTSTRISRRGAKTCQERICRIESARTRTCNGCATSTQRINRLRYFPIDKRQINTTKFTPSELLEQSARHAAHANGNDNCITIDETKQTGNKQKKKFEFEWKHWCNSRADKRRYTETKYAAYWNRSSMRQSIASHICTTLQFPSFNLSETHRRIHRRSIVYYVRHSQQLHSHTLSLVWYFQWNGDKLIRLFVFCPIFILLFITWVSTAVSDACACVCARWISI